MKRSVFTAVAGMVLALSLAACGSSSSNSSTDGLSTTEGTTLPAITSAAAKTVMIGVVQNTQQTMMQGLASVGAAAQVVKTGDPTINCSAPSENTVNCTITDDQGGSCTADMTLNESDPFVSLVMSCENFHPDGLALVNGAYTADISINEAYLQSASIGTKSAVQLSKTDSSSDDCSYDSTDNWPSECTDAGESTCSLAAAALSITYIVGPGDLTVVDSCGTYVFGSGATMTAAACGDLDGEVFLLSFTLDGTFNGEAVSADYNMNCDFSEAS